MKVLDPEKTTIVRNGDWILSLDLRGLLEVASKFTVARILERDDFTKRYNNHTPIALHEFLYPIMQAYDSVMIKADVEMGGTDQLFNLLAGRELMEKMGMEPQVAICMPLLEGTDGVRKMSKSYGNYVGLTDTPDEMFGKVMSIPDNMIVNYYRLCTKMPVAEVEAVAADMAAGTADPNKLKRQLARMIIDNYHGAGKGDEAEENFNRVFKNREIPEDVPEFAACLEGEVYLPGLLQEVGFAASAGEGRRLIDGGGVKLDGTALEGKVYNVPGEMLDGKVLQAGKRRFVRVVAKA